MPKCPKCEAEISELVRYQKSERKCYVSAGENGLVEEEDHGYDFLPDEPDDYECPECCSVVFHTEEDAEDFLIGTAETKAA